MITMTDDELREKIREQKEQQILSDGIAANIADMEWAFGGLKNVPPSTRIALEMFTHGITAVIEELEK